MPPRAKPSPQPLTIDYAAETLRPLACLLFVLPLLLVYEVGVRIIPRGAPGLAAPPLLEKFFGIFGATGPDLPALALVAVLLAWHLFSRQRWSVDLPVLVGMAAESLLWALPLFGLHYLVQLRSVAASTPAGSAWNYVVLSIGAGIYEELVFRLIVMALVLVLVVDVAGVDAMWGSAIAVGVSSLLFAAHHYPPVGNDPFRLGEFSFRFVAGGYLAGIFLFRGFGIAVGAHAMYNVIVVAAIGR